jgi:hypothetical protein
MIPWLLFTILATAGLPQASAPPPAPASDTLGILGPSASPGASGGDLFAGFS